MARPNDNSKNSTAAKNGETDKKDNGKLKPIIAALLIVAVIAGAVTVIAGSLKKNPAEATDPFIAAAKDSKSVSESDPEVQMLSAIHTTVFGTNGLSAEGKLKDNDIKLIAQYGKDLLSSSVYFSYGKNVEALLYDGQYFQYDGGDSLDVAYPAPLLSDSKNIVAGVRGDFLTLFPDLSTTPQFYKIMDSDVNGSIQTAATLVSSKYLNYDAMAEIFNKNKPVMAQFFFGLEYKGSIPDFDVLYKTSADFILNGLSEKSLSVTESKAKKSVTYTVKGNMVSVTEELITYLTDNKTAKLTLGDEFYNKLMTSLNAYVKNSSADRSKADFSGEVKTDKGFITSVSVKNSAGKELVSVSVSDINSAKVAKSYYDGIISRAEKQTVIKDKDSMIKFLESKFAGKSTAISAKAQEAAAR